MTPEAIAAINAILKACPDFESGITRLEDAVDAWRAQGCPMVEVPDREALMWAARRTENAARGVAQLYHAVNLPMDERERHVERAKRYRAVATFLRTIAGEGE